MRQQKIGRQTVNRMCSCSSKSRKEWWYLWRVDKPCAAAPARGYVMCHKCGGNWQTSNPYICKLEGSELFRDELKETTKAELTRIEGMITQTSKKMYQLSMLLEQHREQAQNLRELL